MVTVTNPKSIDADAAARTYRALVVDDDAVARGVAMFALQNAGFDCDAAGDIEEALARIEIHAYDYIVTDLRMPGRHGYYLVQEILARPRRPVLTVLTAVDESKLTKDLLTRGVDAVYIKPADYPSFADEAKTLVARHRTGATENQLSHRASETSASPAVTQPSTDEDDSPEAANAPRASAPSQQSSGVKSQAKSIVAVLLKNVERARELVNELASDAVKVVPVANSDELYTQLNRERVDLIIIEHQLGGFLTGLEMLERLTREQIKPEMMLIAAEHGDLRSQASLLGIDTVLPPGCTLEMMAMSAKRILHHASASNVFIPREARILVQNFDEISSVPQLLVKLLHYMEMPLTDIPLKQLANDISVDPKSTTELLKLTNSASVGLSQEITSVYNAVKLLGPKRAISLIFSSATIAAQSNLIQNWSEETQNWYSQRGVLIANTASAIAQTMETVSGDTAFVLGLLQDIGILILSNSFPHRYELIIKRVRENGRAELTALERDDFNIGHADVSAALLQKWDLPTSLIELIQAHHDDSGDADRSKTQLGFLRAIRIGEALANVKDVSHPTRTKRLNDLLTHYGPSSSAVICELFGNAIAQTAASCELFNLPVPEDASYAQLMTEISRLGSS